MRHLALVFLIGLMALTGQSMASSPAAPMAAGTMVICSGGKTLVVPMGEDGAPIERQHLCPDCMPAALLADIAAHFGPTLTAEFALVLPAHISAVAARAYSATPPARAPPLLSV